MDPEARVIQQRFALSKDSLQILPMSLIASLLFAGCTGYWRDPNQWQSQFSADAASCAQQASQGSGTYTPYDERHQQDFQRCMQGRGWWQVPERR